MTAIVRSVTVRLDPAAAFDVFTSQIGTWFPRGPHSFHDPDRTVGVQLEPGVGGRWRELWHGGGGYEIGRVLAWEPGRRLLVSYRHRHLPADPLTEIEVRFEAAPEGCLVTLEHRGWERLPPEALRAWAGRSWRGLVAAFARYAGEGPSTPTDREQTMTPTSTEAMTPTDVDQQPVVPMVDYADGPAAMDWLARAFGFVERTRWLDDEGRLSHGEMLAGGGLIMLATVNAAYEGPREHATHCGRAAAWLDTPYVVDGLLVRVEDVDAHHATAAGAGARILSEPEDTPYGRLYRAEDPEGHRWMFQSQPGLSPR